MTKVVTVETMRKSDAYTIEHFVDSKTLMLRAGTAIFDSVKWNDPVGIIAGKGNNAGDGFVLARLLQQEGYEVDIVLLEEKFSEDGKYYYDICKEHGMPIILYDDSVSLKSYATIVDCLLGTGFSGEVKEPMKSLINRINESNAYIVSADINSGLNGDTGLGTTFVKSDLTVSIGTYKFGHFIGLANEAMKDKVNCDIGIEIIGEIQEIDY